MPLDRMHLIQVISLEAIKVLGPAAIAAYATYRVTVIQFESKLRKLCISPNPSLRAQQSNPFLLTNQALMDRRVAALLAMTDLCRPSLKELDKKINSMPLI